MTKDATGQEILIGEYYGYSKSSSGMTWVVTGKACKADNGKVTLTEITEKSYFSIYKGNSVPSKTIKSDHKRTLASIQVFHIAQHLMVDQNAPIHDCLQYAVPDGMLYRCSKCNEIL